MAPQECKQLIGNYRGAPYACLRKLQVGIQTDKQVGARPEYVLARMGAFDKSLEQACIAYEQSINGSSPLDPAVALAKLVSLLCLHLELFLTIHPYANGNGHCARLIVWVLLARYGIIPVNWPLDDKPEHPTYALALFEHRRGNRIPLQAFLVRSIHGNLTPPALPAAPSAAP